MAAGDVWEVKAFSLLSNQLGINTFHYRVIANVGGVGVNPAKVSLGWAFLFAAVYKGCLTKAATYWGCSARRISPTVSIADNSDNNRGIGSYETGAAAAGPLQMAGIITWRSGIIGRANRGRSYLPFISSTAVDATTGSPVLRYTDQLTGFGNLQLAEWDVVDGAVTETMLLCIYHRTDPTLHTPVIDFSPQTKFGAQHRRGNYGKLNPPPF